MEYIPQGHDGNLPTYGKCTLPYGVSEHFPSQPEVDRIPERRQSLRILHPLMPAPSGGPRHPLDAEHYEVDLGIIEKRSVEVRIAEFQVLFAGDFLLWFAWNLGIISLIPLHKSTLPIGSFCKASSRPERLHSVMAQGLKTRKHRHGH